MLGLTCLPDKVTKFLYPFKRHFRCAQARHHLLFSWVLVLLSLDSGKATLARLSCLAPSRIRYWAIRRLVASGQWDASALIRDMAQVTLALLPPPADGVLYLCADKTLKGKRGQKHPLAHKTRMNEHSGYVFGFEMVLLLASWGRYRVPVRMGLVDPKRPGHPNLLLRQQLRDFVPPCWAEQVVVLADAGFAANVTFRLLSRKGYGYVFAVSRTRKLTTGQHLSDCVRHLPKSRYHRLASYKPDGRRTDYWVYSRPAALNHLGDVTLIFSKQRRNCGPKKTKILVTNLTRARVSETLSRYSRRWGVELTFKELKGGLHLGQMQVTRDPERVARSVALSVLAYLLLVGLYARDPALEKPFSLFQFKERFLREVFQEQLSRTEKRWKEKFQPKKRAA
jgi:Transposase DDE domain